MSDSKFVINYKWTESARCYLTKVPTDMVPFASDPHTHGVRTWESYAAARRFIAGVEPTLASKLEVEEVGSSCPKIAEARAQSDSVVAAIALHLESQ